MSIPYIEPCWRRSRRYVVAALTFGLLLVGVPLSPTTAADPVLVGAGDIASCSSSGDLATAALVVNIPGTVFTAGDNAYEEGSSRQFADCYGPTWGAFRARTRPAPGNHDYLTAGAAGYFGYFGWLAGDRRKGYYAYDRGAWRIYALNSNCSFVSCAAGSAQVRWLQADLAAHPRRCVLAYWHHPLFSSGRGGDPQVRSLFETLYAARAEVVLAGHDHHYERFAPQTAGGVASSIGIRQFVVGTGGRSHHGWSSVRPNSQVRNASTFGVLKLTLRSDSYEWRFVPQKGKTFTDTGRTTCR